MNTPAQCVPLSVGQEAMWVAWKLDPGQWSHIIPTPFRVRGTLNLDQLRLAVAEVGEAFPQLRARVRTGQEGSVLDWSDAPVIPVRRRRTELDQDAAIRETWQTPFDLRSGPLARVDLIDGPDYTVLLIAVHHLVYDGASILLLLDALRTAYEGARLPREDHAPALAAFAAHSRELADGPSGEDHRLHWKADLGDGGGDFALPSGAQEPRYTVLSEKLPADLAKDLRARATEAGMSYATLLMGAYFALLRRHSGASDVLSFLPYHGRCLPELSGRVGYFVNALPVRVPVRDDDTYADLLGRVRSRVKETLAHGDLPLPAIMRAAGLTGPEAQRRTHQTVFQYWHAGLRDGVDVHDVRLRHDGAEARLSLLDMESTAGFRLALMVREDSCGTHLLWKDPAGSLGATVVRAMADDYTAVLRALADDPRAGIGEVVATARTDAGGTAPGGDGGGDRPASAAAAGDTARLNEMAEVWQSVLGTGPVAPGDSFFELGGHSLLAERLVAAVRERFPASTATIRLLFDHPRLGEFAAHALPAPASEAADRPLDGTPAAAAGTDRPRHGTGTAAADAGRPAGAPSVQPGPAATATPEAGEAAGRPVQGVGDRFPASSFQRRVWLAQRVGGDPAAYNVPLAWRVEHPLDADGVSRALAATIARHEILRTAFHEVDGDLMQTVRAPWVPGVQRIDLADRPDPQAALQNWIRTAAHEPFDLASGRLLTAALIELGPAGQVLFVCLHHLLWDGECEEILLKELDAHYTEASGPEAPLPTGEEAPAGTGADVHPASAHQERMWFVDRFENGHLYPAAPTYHNLPLFLRLDGLPDRTALARRVAAVVRAHEALRTELVELDGRVVQRVRTDATVVPAWLPAGPGDAAGAEVPDALTDWARTPFDLSAGPLLRIAVLPDQGSRGGWIALCGHQAVIDRVSLETVAGQIVAGPDAREPRPTGYQAWRDSEDEAAGRAHLAARAAVLRPPADPLRLPERRTRDAVHVYEERSVAFAVPADVALGSAAERLGAQVTDVALAAFAALLQWYSGQEDMVLGLSHAGRREQDRHVVGPLSNLLPVRLRPEAGLSFAGLVERTAAETAHARTHDRAPFDELVRLVDPSKDMSRTALFDVLYSYLPAAAPLPVPEGAAARPVDAGGGRGKYDLHLCLRPDGDGGHRARLVYNGRYFDHDQITAMAAHYVTALRLLTERPDSGVAEIDPLSEAERHTQLRVWNATEAGYEETPAHDLIRRRAEARPADVALTDGAHSVAYGDLLADARAVAQGLLAAGVRQGELVALLFPRGADQVRAVLGTLLAGAAYLPIDPAVPDERREFILSDSGVRVALAPSAGSDGHGFDGRVLALDELLAPATRGAEAPLPSVPLDSPAYCIYTSGTTGRPKGVVLTHRNLVRLLVNDRLPFAFGPQDVWTMFHSYAFDFSVWELFGGLVHGGRVVLVSEDETRDPGLFFDLLQRERVTVLNQTPSAFRRLIGLRPSAPDGLAALRYVVFGGEALRPAMLTEWSERFPQVRLVNMYGITETTVHASVRTVSRGDMETDTSVVGTPIPTTRLHLLDRHTGRRLLPVGAVGEIYVGGDGVAGGYLGRPELTAQRFVPSPFGDGTLFRSGDLAARLPDGSLRFIGRADSQVQLRGYRIEPGEVQTCLCDHPGVSDAVVFAEDDRLIAVVRGEQGLSAGELRGHLARRLPSYMVPSLFHVVASIPLTVNGKIDMAALRAQTAALAAPARRAPRSGTPAALAAVWRDLLGVPTVGEDDSFFGLGGHSMLAVRLIGEIAERFGADLPIKTLFETPRLGDLADVIDRASGRTAADPDRPSPDAAPAAPRGADRGSAGAGDRAAAPAAAAASPASAFQRRMWLAEQTGQGSPANVFLGWTVEGRLDTAVLEDALARLVAGHEILRTAFRAQGGTVRQVVQEPWRPRIEICDPTGAEGPEETATRWLDGAAGQPFDLASGRLLRAAVADCGPRGQAFMLCLHHLVVDGESVPVLLRELERRYRDSLAGLPSEPPALQYREHAAALERSGDLRRDADLDFWAERLTGWPARLDLPAPARTEADGAVRLVLPEGLLGRLRPVMDEHGATWFMLMAAALATGLHRWSGLPRVTFGVPASIRDRDSADLLGPCLNLVVLRSSTAGDGPAGDLLRAMRTEVLDAFEHARTPFDEVLARLRPEQGADRAPFGDVVINMNLRADRHAVLGGAALRPVFAESLWSHEAKFGITLTVAEQDGELDAVLSHRGDRVSAADAARLADAVTAFLVELADGRRPAQYRDFVQARETARAGARHEADLAHWHEHLGGAPAYVELPAPEEPAPHGVVEIPMPAGVGERLRALHERHGLSPFMTAATALALLLHHRTGTDDVVISSPMTHRGPGALADVFGPCLNTVALRSRLRPDATVREALEAMRDTTLDAFAHREAAFEDVVDRINPPRRPGRTPYCDVSLAFSTAAGRPPTLGGRALRAVELDGGDAAYTGKLGLTVALVLDGGELRGRMAYHGGLVRRDDVEQLADALAALLAQLPDHLDTPVTGLELIPRDQLDRMRAWERGPLPGPATTVPELILEQARVRPDAKAVDSDRGTLDYRGLVARARSLAGAVRPHLPADGPTVALLLERGEDFVVAMLAAWFAGAAFCPLDPSWPAARQEFVLDDVRADVLLTREGITLPSTGRTTVLDVAKAAGTADGGDTGAGPAWSPQATAYVIYTSGTTGTPKGVVVRHGGLANLVRSVGDTQGIGPEDRCTHLLSVSFDSSQMEVWQALAHGACLVPHERPVVASTLGAWLDRKGATVAFCATALAEAMWSAGTAAPRTLRWLGIGGAALSQRPPAGLPYRLLNSYGPTENTVAASEHVIDGSGSTPLNCIGRPIAGVRMLVLDAAGRRCPLGTTGEIHLAGDSLAVGYLRRPELTEDRFRTIDLDGAPLRVYRTGDLGRRLGDGTVEYLGRADRQLKLRGYRIEPGEIEHFLLRQPEVAQAAVTGDPQRTPALVAYVTPQGAHRPDSAELLRRARAELPAFMVPEAVVVLPALPLTTSGKVDHAALPRPERGDLVGAAGHVAPGNDTERRVAALWSEVLGLSAVSVHDNFFDLGGNSLALAKLHGKVVAAFGRELPVTALFEHPTVAALAKALDPARRDGGPADGGTEPRRPQRSGRQARRGRRRPGTTEGA
ncbi:amino acid adenylation domain-containing protein [Streptomyces sp. NPDC015171]|uniref:amino acid adenylation domain-containing protein n=1 Tax=Streptomyces sp. NPDC015171 TaxID=3364945 RepID=UPI0036FE5630